MVLRVNAALDARAEPASCSQPKLCMWRFALWLNFLVFASAFPAILCGVEIAHGWNSTLTGEWQVLIVFGSVTFLNGAALWSWWQDGVAGALASVKVALVANISFNAIDIWTGLRTSRTRPSTDALAPLPDLMLCAFALLTLPRDAAGPIL